jgi:small subunit ribosomal protein S20
MPNKKSAIKEMRKSAKRRERNRRKLGTVKTLVKSVKKLIEEGKKEAGAALSKAQSALDKNKKIHPKKASRIKSRLAKKISATSKAASKK